MSHAFRELLRKVGSGTHTNEKLTRAEAAAAARMMLLQEATPAQIGAFLIAHRIRRPTGEELAGMLDAYAELGPKLRTIGDRTVTVLGVPYDGRSRTAPIGPLTALVLATAGCPVVMHGGDRMPTKEGDPLIDYWQGLGLDWTSLTLEQVQTVLEQVGLGFVHLPTHFPLAQGLVPYREQIGKRPPLATMELMWCPYDGTAHVVSGFVHPPTEGMFREAFALRGVTHFTTVKGLEGSCDLPRERAAIIGLSHAEADQSSKKIATPIAPDLSQESSELPYPPIERLHLHASEYGFENRNVAFEPISPFVASMKSVLEGQPSELMQSVLWNGGFYLWRCGQADSIAAGIAETERLLTQGQVMKTLQAAQRAMTSFHSRALNSIAH